MTKRLPSSLMLGCLALLTLVFMTEVQAQRPSKTLFIAVRGGATAYGGELDGTGVSYGNPDSELGWLTSDLGAGAGAEIGYQFDQHLGFALGFFYGKYTNLDRDDAIVNGITGARGLLNPDGNEVTQIQALFRYMPWPSSKLTPYIQFGGVVARGQGQETDGSGVTGYGPHLGGGLDLQLGRHLSLFAELSTAFIFPDDAVDNANPGGNTLFLPGGDDADYDNLNMYGGGLRYFFRGPGNRVNVMADCSSELNVGQSGSFTASSNADATGPVSYAWNFGDGTSGTGMTASHAFSAPGSYTVSVTAQGPYNSDTDTCLVNVIDVLSVTNCRVSPSRADIGQTVTVNADVTGSEPREVTVDFGDGDTADSLPATHSYSDPGTYTVTITATNATGSDSTTCTVTVGDVFCDEVTELNTVYFDYEMSSLSSEARGRLDENIEVLTRCPNICVVINGYADDQERDKLRLSERRADEAQAYYVANGIDESRIVARGLGEHPDSNSKEDPGPGDRNARRADSIPVDCSRLDSFN
ncbi:MAG: PKD domain-containing protein [Bacteroidetes bacterium]|nr:PKD domain-containing protein [Bacteroidota bacterium]